ncbi:MAG: hypothetical protein QXF12_01220 [Candidatus Aenigmatarchaeota archaeon]
MTQCYIESEKIKRPKVCVENINTDDITVDLVVVRLYTNFHLFKTIQISISSNNDFPFDVEFDDSDFIYNGNVFYGNYNIRVEYYKYDVEQETYILVFYETRSITYQPVKLLYRYDYCANKKYIYFIYPYATSCNEESFVGLVYDHNSINTSNPVVYSSTWNKLTDNETNILFPGFVGIVYYTTLDSSSATNVNLNLVYSCGNNSIVLQDDYVFENLSILPFYYYDTTQNLHIVNFYVQYSGSTASNIFFEILHNNTVLIRSTQSITNNQLYTFSYAINLSASVTTLKIRYSIDNFCYCERTITRPVFRINSITVNPCTQVFNVVIDVNDVGLLYFYQSVLVEINGTNISYNGIHNYIINNNRIIINLNLYNQNLNFIDNESYTFTIYLYNHHTNSVIYPIISFVIEYHDIDIQFTLNSSNVDININTSLNNSNIINSTITLTHNNMIIDSYTENYIINNYIYVGSNIMVGDVLTVNFSAAYNQTVNSSTYLLSYVCENSFIYITGEGNIFLSTPHLQYCFDLSTNDFITCSHILDEVNSKNFAFMIVTEFFYNNALYCNGDYYISNVQISGVNYDDYNISVLSGIIFNNNNVSSQQRNIVVNIACPSNATIESLYVPNVDFATARLTTNINCINWLIIFRIYTSLLSRFYNTINNNQFSLVLTIKDNTGYETISYNSYMNNITVNPWLGNGSVITISGDIVLPALEDAELHTLELMLSPNDNNYTINNITYQSGRALYIRFVNDINCYDFIDNVQYILDNNSDELVFYIIVNKTWFLNELEITIYQNNNINDILDTKNISLTNLPNGNQTLEIRFQNGGALVNNPNNPSYVIRGIYRHSINKTYHVKQTRTGVIL